jgi:hypothetical protein
MFCKVQATLLNSLQKFGGEDASADIAPTSAFTAVFKKIIEDNDFPPDLVFNVDKTRLC